MVRAVCCLFLCLVAFTAQAQDDPWFARADDGSAIVQLHFFWSRTCPHCARAHPFVEALANELPWLDLTSYPLDDSLENQVRFDQLSTLAGSRPQAVPAFAFCGEMHFGYDDASGMGAFLRERLTACHAGLSEAAAPAAPALPRLPLVGAVTPESLSLPAFTLVLAGLDAFNPCAFFVLLFLLSLMVHARSRARMLLVGGVFVAISGLVYFAFMAAWLNLFLVFGQVRLVTLAAGALALALGGLNVKDYAAPGAGPSLSIPERAKPGRYRRTRGLVEAASVPAVLAGTVMLALAANTYELLCTAGFPMVFTRILTLAGLSAAGHYLYLAAYNIIYVLPLFAIVVAFAWTLGGRKLSARGGRLLKLMSGLMMLGLGGVLLLAPAALDSPLTALGLLALALGGTLVAGRLDRRPTAALH